MLFVLDPTLSDVPQCEASEFLDAAEQDLSTTQLVRVRTLDNVIEVNPGPADGVVLFNRPRAEVSGDVEDLLTRAAASGAVILPIALAADQRRPPGAVGDRQSFDVTDHLRRRDLQPSQRFVVARAFAREALSRVQPTYSHDRMRLFLCHRRTDGEDLAARLDERLEALHDHVFRDLISVQVGERAQVKIDEALATADVLAFLDTPGASESWWVAHELSGALGRSIPVVWVRLGSEQNRTALPVPPGPRPDLVCADMNLGPEYVQSLADAILEKAFEQARAHVRTSQQAVRAIQRWAAANGGSFETLDARRLIFELSHPGVRRSYPTRPATDIVQFFARHPTGDDRKLLEEFLNENGMGPHQHDCRSFDAALLLDPTATGDRVEGSWSVIEHPDRFLQSLGPSQPKGATADDPVLLILGAFPSDDLASQEVKSAVHAVATTWLRNGGRILCGGHPTFTPLIIEAARLVAGTASHDRVTVYQSQWFVSPAAIEDLEAHVAVVATPALQDQTMSLTEMRVRMIQPGSAVAAIAIGGRTADGGSHVPGIDQEVQLARSAAVPVYLLGAPGGRAAELAIAAQGEIPQWSSLGNSSTNEENEFMFETSDYEEAGRLIWGAVAS